MHDTRGTAESSQDATGDAELSVVPLSKDDAFHLLQNKRRRAVLRYLIQEGDDQFAMRDVAEAVAAWEHDTTVRQLTSDERQRVYIALYQSHLPTLDEHDVIDYDQNRGMVEPRARLALLTPFLPTSLDAADELVAPDADREEGKPDEDSSSLHDFLALFST